MSASFVYTHRQHGPRISIWELNGRPDYDGWQHMLADASRFLMELERRGKTMGVIIDASGLQVIDAGMRRDAGQWRAENMALIANVVPCASYVARSAWLRGAITAIFWFAPPVVPVGVRATRDEALDWIERELSEMSRSSQAQ